MAKQDTAKKPKSTKKDDAKRKGEALDPKAAKQLAKQAAKDQADAAKAAAKAEEKAAKAAKSAAKVAPAAKDGKSTPKSTPKAGKPQKATAGVDEVHVLRLALRDTEAKLTETEAALRRAQQELDDERRAAADARLAPIEDAVVELAVAETVAEAVAHTGVTPADTLTAALVADEVADELDAAITAAAIADVDEDHTGEAADAAAAFTAPAVVSPPEPVATARRSDEAPNESWTLIRLRAEARARDLTGFSTLSKSALLARLRA